MPPMTDPQAPTSDLETPAEQADLAENALVEEVSIDGMCGVY